MRMISHAFHKNANKKNILICVIIFFVFLATTSPLLIQYMAMPSIEGTILISATDVLKTIDTWGANGRQWQIIFHLTWDLVFPLLAITLFALVLSWLTNHLYHKNSQMQKLNLLALLYGFDYLENITIIILIISHPIQLRFFAYLKMIFTILKFAFGAFLIFIIVILFAKFLYLQFNQKIGSH